MAASAQEELALARQEVARHEEAAALQAAALAVGKIRQLTIADLLAESIRRVSNEESISALFDLS